MKVAHFYCYGPINRTSGISALKVANFIAALPSDCEEIQVHINSMGGHLHEGYSIHDLLQASGKKIVTIAEGLVASVATVIFGAGSERLITPNSQLMTHLPLIIMGGEDSQEEVYRSEDLIDLGSEMKMEEDRMIKFYASKTGLSIEQVTPLVSKDTYMSADEAIKLGFATKIAEPLKAVAYLNPTNKKDTMSKDKKFAELIADAYKVLKGEATIVPVAPIVAASQTTSEGTVIYFEGTLAEGTMVFTDEAMSMPCADGAITLDNGSTLTITGGSVTSIEEVAQVDPAVASLTQENATLKAEVEKLTLEVQAKAAEKLQMETEGGKVIAELTEKVRTQTRTETLAEVKSKFTPKVSGEQFKEKQAQLTDAERKAEIERIRKGKKQTESK